MLTNEKMLDSINEFGNSIYNEFRNIDSLVDASHLFTQAFSFVTKESKWNPRFRLTTAYSKLLQDIVSSSNGGQLFFFQTKNAYHVISCYKTTKPVHVVGEKKDKTNDIEDENVLAWICTDILRIANVTVERNSYERIDVGSHGEPLGIKLCIIFAVARLKQKKTHCIFKRLNKHKNVDAAVKLCQSKPTLLWK